MKSIRSLTAKMSYRSQSQNHLAIKSGTVGALVVAILAPFAAIPTQAQSTRIEESVRLLGQPLSVRQFSGIEQPCLKKIQNSAGQWVCAQPETAGASVTQDLSVEIFGRPRTLLHLQTEAGLGPSPTPAHLESPTPRPSGQPFWASKMFEDSTLADVESDKGLTVRRHELYVGGARLWTGRLRWQDGSLRYTGGVPPTQIPVPIILYPLGPLVLKLEAGLEFEGLLNVRLMPGLSFPLRDSTLIANLDMRLYAAAYLQASAQLLLLKGGIEGRVNVFDAKWGAHTFFYVNGLKPRTMTFGYAELFSGKVLGFIDYRFFTARWKRLHQNSLYEWNGKCLSFANGVGGC
jgi:hypothetical protein